MADKDFDIEIVELSKLLTIKSKDNPHVWEYLLEELPELKIYLHAKKDPEPFSLEGMADKSEKYYKENKLFQVMSPLYFFVSYLSAIPDSQMESMFYHAGHPVISDERIRQAADLYTVAGKKYADLLKRVYEYSLTNP